MPHRNRLNNSSNHKSCIQEKHSNTKTITIFHQNIQHFASRVDSLLITIDLLKPDIIILSETKLTINDINNISIIGYICASFYVRNDNQGGGVIIFISETLSFRKINAINKLNEDKIFESCAIEIKLSNNKFIIGGIYRTPSENVDTFCDKLNKYLHILTKINSKVIIGGDMNVDVLVNNNKKIDFVSVLKMNGLYYTINIPTRVTDMCASAIDNFITNVNKDECEASSIITALSDHDGQIFLLKLKEKNIKKCRQLKLEKRYFDKNSKIKFINDLKKEDWTCLYLTPIQNKFSFFYNVLKYHFDINFPKHKSRIKKKKYEWLDEEIKEARENLIETYHNCRNKSKEKTLIKKQNKTYKRLISNKRKEYFNNKVSNSSNTIKTAWQLINSDLGRERFNLKQINLKLNNKLITDPNIVSNILNNNFVEMVSQHVIPKLGNKCFNTQIKTKTVLHNFRVKTIDEEQLSKVIDSLKNKSSSGYDEIPINIIKEAKTALIKPLLHVINSSLITGIYPEELKVSKIVPIYKKGASTDPMNYRPIALQPSLSKIFEKCFLLQLAEFFEVNNLIDEQQHGFRKNRSTQSALIHYIENIIDELDIGTHTLGAFLDLTKAFDSVCHATLLNKMESYGIVGKELNWLKSYLEKRKQYVEIKYINNKGEIKQAKSSLRQIKFSVPQGSILGPFLFLCYMGNLPNLFNDLINKIDVCMYADDISLAVSGKNLNDVVDSMHNAVLNINSFLSSNNLLLNSDKTTYLEFSCKNSGLNLINNKYKKDVHFLGLKLDCHLNWNRHVEFVCNKISSGIFAIKRLAYICNLNNLKMLYHALIQSHISYGIEIYGGTSQKNLNRILHLQKVAIRLILKLENNETCKERFSDLGILTVYGLYIYKTIIVMLSNSNNIPKHSNIHKYNTRNKSNFAIPKHNKEIYKKKPTYAGIHFWEKIPKEIRNESSNKNFKIKLKEYLVKRTLYSLNEL